MAQYFITASYCICNGFISVHRMQAILKNNILLDVH